MMNKIIKLLFSIPFHEEQDIINNQIENILNFNPNSHIIYHINKSFVAFNDSLTDYPNVYLNSKRFNYKYAKGLLWIHINNFLEAIRLNIDFDYFIIISSNEMFIRDGLDLYIDHHKNGAQIVRFDINNTWHNFQKGLEKDDIMIRLINDLKLDTIYGGQTEGQFYEKHIFQKIADIYIQYFGNTELHHFETEEIVAQTIFKSFGLDYGKPITLQNYSNKISFNEELISNIINNRVIIPNNSINKTLVSPHINSDCSSIYSIKRVDRTFNSLRSYLSRKGFILNKEIFNNNTYYYSNNSQLYFKMPDYLTFKKSRSHTKKDFNWFGYEVEKGQYIITFDILTRHKIIINDKIGIKIHYPYEMIYNYFLDDMPINTWTKVSFPAIIAEKQIIVFIFDDYLYDLDISIKNIKFNGDRVQDREKENIIICLYQKISGQSAELINYNNINNMILEPLSKLYNIFIFNSMVYDNSVYKIINYYRPYHITFFDNIADMTINNIFIKNTDNIIKFVDKSNITIKFITYFSIDSIFRLPVPDFNFYVNKFNFCSYSIPYIDNNISNSYDFISIPYRFINYFSELLRNNIDNLNICYSIYYELKDIIGKNNFNFIYNENYSINMRNPLIKYINDIDDIYNNKGYLFSKKYMTDINYINKYSYICKKYDGEFYFRKNKTEHSVNYQWIGLDIDYVEKSNAIVEFDINLKMNLNLNLNMNNFGLKTHQPITYYNEWINECILNEYVHIKIGITIERKSQYIILNFDNYLNEVEFYISNFKIYFVDI